MENPEWHFRLLDLPKHVIRRIGQYIPTCTPLQAERTSRIARKRLLRDLFDRQWRGRCTNMHPQEFLLLRVMSSSCYDVARDYLRHEASVNTVDYRAAGWSVLMIAASDLDSPLESLIRVVKWLLNMGADMDFVARDGMTALHVAVMKGNVAVARMMLLRGMEVNSASPWGKTPLHLDATGGHRDMVRLLLAGGAEWERMDENGKTAQDVARGERVDMFGSITKTWARTNSEDAEGIWTLAARREIRPGKSSSKSEGESKKSQAVRLKQPLWGEI